ncbi:MAG: guanylate kinase [Acidobacteriota bacterium]|jgi:guanylate kinase|nr:guanylate kinase [Acidobacteriota bacterium]
MSSNAEAQSVNETSSATEAGRGILVVVSSPSGGGKGTLIRRVLKAVPHLGYSVSFTTRGVREGEVNGREYFFVSEDEFRRKIEAGDFLEWAVVHGKHYGTSHLQVQRELNAGSDIVMEVDVQGATSVRRLIDDAVTVFILPPAFEILRSRLEARGSEDKAELALRLKNARTEVEHYREFKYIIINDDADRAAAQLASIIHAERATRDRQEAVAQGVLKSFKGATD